jgi:hypothetical protein
MNDVAHSPSHLFIALTLKSVFKRALQRGEFMMDEKKKTVTCRCIEHWCDLLAVSHLTDLETAGPRCVEKERGSVVLEPSPK